MTTAILVRASDGRVVGHYPDLSTAQADEEPGLTARGLEEGEEYEPSLSYTDDAGSLIPDLQPLREGRKDTLAAYRDSVVLATIETSKGTFYGDAGSQRLMAGRLLGILIAERRGLTVPTTIRFKSVSGWGEFPLDDFMDAALEYMAAIDLAFGEQSNLDAEIDTLTDPAAIAAVEWP